MKKEKSISSKAGDVPVRLTRARAAALSATGELPPKPLNEVVQENQKHPLGVNSEKAVSDNTRPPRQKRAVLEDVTNICQAKKIKLTKPDQLNVSTKVPSVSSEFPQFQTDSKDESLQEIGLRSEEAMCSVNLEDNAPLNLIGSQTSGISAQPLISQDQGLQTDAAETGSDSELLNAPKDPDIPNIDADIEDLQLCSFYAADIFDNLRIAELSRRPHPNFMETVQRDLTPGMRGILIDWLVEVSEEFNLQANTLYLTVYLIDWFLSKTYIERQRLQLLGITCMLIASKYEEIHGPHVEDFCVITDNTYTREEVLNMEIQVLKSSAYQLFAPTAKHFLRRFLRAAQASYQIPSIELEYLANYLAELTLTNYGFLNFVPSMIAASAVFLARWTLDQSRHPWNPTLEHYASYKASDLKATVLALQGLQLNSDDCPLTATRTKYRQDKFNSVAVLSSPKLLETMF